MPCRSSWFQNSTGFSVPAWTGIGAAVAAMIASRVITMHVAKTRPAFPCPEISETGARPEACENARPQLSHIIIVGVSPSVCYVQHGTELQCLCYSPVGNIGDSWRLEE